MKMKKFKLNYFNSTLPIIAFILSFTFLFGACGASDNNTKTKDLDSNNVEIVEEVDKIVYPLPTPFETTKILNKAGASYILDVTNPIENVDKYFTEKGKALNLGVYGADLSYTSTYNKTQETSNFFSCTKKLTDELGISTPFTETLTEKIESNIENKDSLYTIITKSYHDTFEFLNNNGKGAISTLILTGGWIEGLYISSQLASLTPNNGEILKGIAKQRTTLYTLISLLESYKENADIEEILNDIKKFKEVFDKVEETNGVLTLTNEQFSKIMEIVEKIRKKIVETP